MEYLEKAKYELILALKNNEDENIIEVYKKYYEDIKDIVLQSPNLKDKKVQFVLSSVNKNDLTLKQYFFSNEHDMNIFIDKFRENHLFTCSKVLEIDPENDHRPLEYNFKI